MRVVIPQGSILNNSREEVQQQPSRTYRLDPVTKRIYGMIDGIEAVKQAVRLTLGTERFEHLIYSSNYGGELREMSGADSTYFSSEIKRRIREALIQDDRIREVQDFRISHSGDSALVTFTVISVFGNFQEEKAVNVRV